MITETQFPFLAEKGHIVSLVGGGGKTTLLYAMAAHCARKGWRVLVMTTTHILRPDGFWAHTEEELEALWAAGHYAVAGTPAPENKLTGLPEPQRTAWMARADAVFIEADGARHFPCKAPAAHEPVLLPQSDIVLAVAGLSAMEKPLQEVCFRWEQALPWLSGATPESAVTPALLAQLLANARGGRKEVGDRQFYAVLNQADTPERERFGLQTQALLQQHGVPCVLTRFKEGERA